MNSLTPLLSSIALALILFLPSCATAPAPLSSSAQPERDLIIAQNTFNWINAHRAKEGANKLARAASLDRLARKASAELATDPRATFRKSVQGSCDYALQILKYNAVGLSYQGAIADEKEPGLTALNYWTDVPHSSGRILESYTNIGIGSYTKSDGQTVLTVILGRRFSYDPTTWNKTPARL